MNGIAEFRLPDASRVDVFTGINAWEVEWAKKWKEAIGQALLYQALSGKPGGVILLVGREPLDVERKYILRCCIACREANLKFKTVQVDK